jgi:hypothetical protein
MSLKPITDRAEVAIDFPDKAYMGSFGRSSAFEAGADADGVRIRLARTGEDKRVAEIHLHHYLFAAVLADVAAALAARPPLDEAHRAPLREAARALLAALEPRPPAAAGAAPGDGASR